MISVKFSYYGHGTLICLCDDCKKKLMEVLQPANNSEIPNSSDTISRQAVLDALNNIEIPRNASWYQYYQQALTAVDKLPPAQPTASDCWGCNCPKMERLAQPEPSQVAKDIARIVENGQDMRVIAQGRIRGHWIPVGGALYQCDKCGVVSLKRKFCSECGADMREVTE